MDKQQCKVKAGTVDAGRLGTLITTVDVDGMKWSVVLWVGEDDPDLFKTSCLLVAKETWIEAYLPEATPMPDPTAQQLHDLMQPLFEREPGLRPDRLLWSPTYLPYDWVLDGGQTRIGIATQLCESQMARWLSGKRDIEIGRGGKPEYPQDWFYVSFTTQDEVFGEWQPILVQALASACSAVLDAKEPAV